MPVPALFNWKRYRPSRRSCTSPTLSRRDYDHDHASTSPGLGHGNVRRGPLPYWHVWMRPSEALNASPAEMANLTRMLLNQGRFDEHQLVSPESIERMETPMSTLGARPGCEWATVWGTIFAWQGPSCPTDTTVAANRGSPNAATSHSKGWGMH